MSSKTSRVIQGANLPGAEARQSWVFPGGRRVRAVEPSQLEPGRGCYGLSAKEAVSVPLWINSSDPSLLEQLVRMEMEQLKLDVATDAGRLYDYQVVAEDGPRRQVEVSMITPESLEEIPTEPSWGRYDLAARFLPLPSDAMIFFRELGEWVVAFTKGSKLVYLHPLGPGALDDDVAKEAKCLLLQLAEQSQVMETPALYLWLEGEGQGAEAHVLQQHFGTEVAWSHPPEPELPKRFSSPGFDPPVVARQRQRSERRGKAARLVTAIAAAYGLLILGGWFYLQQREADLAQQESELAVLMPDAERIREIQGRWEDLREAVDPDRYPLETFHQCAVLLPSRGVRLTHFEVNGPRIVVSGEASTTAQAIQYRNALLSAPSLSHYQWDSPKPDILPDNRAKFQAFGVLRASAVPPS